MINTNRINQKGFTLIELAIVLVIVGVLIGSFIGSFAQRIENARIAETEEELEDIKTALTGYAYRYGYLPCPDCFDTTAGACPGGAGAVARDGVEDRNVGACSVIGVGTLPWVTLGLAQGDAWGTRYRYWADANYSDDGAFTLTTTNGIGRVFERTDDGTALLLSADNIAAIVISNGKNGYGGVSISGIDKESIPVVNIDEANNVNNGNVFVSRPPSAATATTAGGEFDDILIWIPEFELKAKMVEAGVLP